MSTASDLPPSPASWAWLRLNRQLEVSALDAQASALLAGTHGLLDVEQNRLVSPTRQLAIDRALAEALKGRTTALLIPRPKGRWPLSLRCAPCASTGGVLVSVRDARTEQACVQCLRDLFGLTHAEASVTSWLAQGLRSNDIAQRLGIQPNTVLAHLKKVLAKTGAPHQVALLALVLRSVAMQHGSHVHGPHDPFDPPES